MKIRVYDSDTGVLEGERTMFGWFFYDMKRWSLKVALYNLWFTVTGKV